MVRQGQKVTQQQIIQSIASLKDIKGSLPNEIAKHLKRENTLPTKG